MRTLNLVQGLCRYDTHLAFSRNQLECEVCCHRPWRAGKEDGK
jgi:hypothetical protein